MIAARASVYASTTHCSPASEPPIAPGQRRDVHDRDVELDHDEAQADGYERGGRPARPSRGAPVTVGSGTGAEVTVHAFKPYPRTFKTLSKDDADRGACGAGGELGINEHSRTMRRLGRG